ncbi:ran GTPase-activating protein 1-like [Stylophora pistillata]|uniref:ran GTPase-activating protein 1-like n=1 Tax=Stylophora pistillata TaxID=50429 RepID=UPI000C051E6E|nr:ran GTPase-activating protein 1-like [Stylophora pistillata]
MLDLNAVVLTSSGESKDVEKYADLLLGNSFLKKSGGRNFVYLTDIANGHFHSELLPELISAQVCSSQPPVDNLVNNENNDIDVPLTENHCLSLVRNVGIRVYAVKEAARLKNVLPLVTAPREIRIWVTWKEEEEKAFKDQLIESAINGINFTDNLHSLKLKDINIAEKCATFISDSLQHSPNLRELHLWCIPLHRGVSHLAENLHHVPQLTKLVLQYVQMGEKECAALAASLKYLNKLEVLDIKGNALGHEIIELAKNLNNVPNLTKLRLGNTNMGEDEALALAASLKYLNKLEKLDIRKNALGHGIIELAKSLNNVPNLTKLNLSNTNMGEDEASALAHALKYVPLLRYLILECNPLGHGIRDLVQHLSSVPELERLNLKGVQMTRTEFEELSTVVNERNVYVNTDYHRYRSLFETGINRLRTKAELKKEGIRFRNEPDDDDEDDEDNDDVDGDEQKEEDNDDDVSCNIH